MLDLLRHVEADTIYLVGDIIDGWRLRSGWYWPQAHNDVVQKLLRKVRRGARMVFVPGNHDEFARQFVGLTFGGIEIKRQRDPRRGRRQALPRHARRRIRRRRASLEVARLSSATGPTTRAVHQHPFQRRASGAGSASPTGRSRPGRSSRSRTRSISSARSSASSRAKRKRRGVDGVVCGHIHHPTIREMDGRRPTSTPATSSNPARWSSSTRTAARSAALVEGSLCSSRPRIEEPASSKTKRRTGGGEAQAEAA